MCILSNNFVIKPLIHHSSKPSVNESSFENKIMSWQEQSVTHFILTQPESKPSHSGLSQCIVGHSNRDSLVQSSLTDFICLEHAHEQFTSRLIRRKKELERLEAEQEKQNQGPRSIAQIRRARSLLSSQSFDDAANLIISGKESIHPTSLLSLCSPHELNIICRWKTKDDNDDVVEGWHHIKHLAVHSSCPLSISAKFDPVVTHNFSLGPLHVEMTVSIRNSLFDSTNFTLSVDPIVGLAITGKETFSSRLKGGEEMFFPLEFTIFRDGVYNLQNIKLKVHDQSSNTYVPYSVPHQWILRVNA